MKDAFWQLHSGLDREGPGTPEDVIWAAGLAGVAPEARICDAGCGPGGDIAALLDVAPRGRVTAIDKHRGFVDDVLARHGDDPRVEAYTGDLAKLKGPYDFVWCAGAMYFVGIRKALRLWRPILAKGGAVAFSEPAFFTETPSEAARVFWDGYETETVAGIGAHVAAAGYETLGTRIVSDAAWEAYFGPLESRIDALRARASEAMTAVLDAHAVEIATWRAVKAETGYLLSVVRPV